MAAAFDRTSEDIGNIVEFGHVNVRVDDQQKAVLFYLMALGLTRDPYLQVGTDNMWVNVGAAQFHLPMGAPQVLRGTVDLVLPDLAAAAARLAAVAPRLAGTRFGWAAVDGSIEATCPWGNRLRLHAPDAAQWGRIRLGMPAVEIEVAPGTSAGIARFYRTILANPAQCGEDGRGAFVRVPAGPVTALVFRETASPLAPYDGHHIQIGLADFSGPHRRLLERGLITEESDQHQYRFQHIIDPDSGQVLATLEHEVRSMRHPLFARTLVNRDPRITNAAYAPGHEAAAWWMPPG